MVRANNFNYSRISFYMAWGFFCFVFFKNAWVADDAYISFRSIEQLFAGNGPRWNIDERVQVYTSPLWFLLLCVGRIFSDNLFLVAILLSFLCCLAALFFAFKVIKDRNIFCLFVVAITSVWAMMDFSSSGLENPLLYALLAAYVFCYLEFFPAKNQQRETLFQGLCLILGLLAITRHDVATLVLIPSVYVGVVFLRDSGFGKFFRPALLVLMPLLLWTCFSLLYYGMPFPNTAYAKMSHGVPRAELIDFGLLYLKVSLMFDLFAPLLMLLVLLRLLCKRELPLVFLTLGVLVNLVYVVYVGGDFMIGRFISTALLITALAFFSAGLFTEKVYRKGLGLLGAVFVGGIIFSNVPLKLAPDSGFDISLGQRHYSWRGILSERNFYFKTNSLWAYLHRDTSQPFPNHKWCKKGLAAGSSGKNAAEFGGIGMYGYCAGPELIIIDNLALADPFLARLPMPPEGEWRAGHFHRAFPAGYRESRLSESNHLQSSSLRALWEDIVLLTQGDLFSIQRLKAICRVNTGHHARAIERGDE